MRRIFNFYKSIFLAIRSLWNGMKLTGYYSTHPKMWLVQPYPENRDTLVIPSRFKGNLTLKHDAENFHACTACGICEINCPNGTIKIISAMEEQEDGKKKKVLDKWQYHMGLCTFCGLCVDACPSEAIEFENTFEHAAYKSTTLNKVLNKPGSKLKPAVK
ncbi:4Fe-4S binding protein [uncultured Acetobacteroides sp.]|uniref:4Fe-4S binding protein n=1 Tax=uncultured Acetobacteroides sp. TaxID=1760811 RepID=UPI0029F4ECD5|nr:4Fe-4S binding protein [uncultured Acetobacteroides sp.]